MHLIKRLLFKILGLQRYLQTIRNIFFFSYNNGFLKNKEEYFVHYYIKKLIKKGDNIVDIGANLGYYSKIFAQLTGKSGHVYSVEPVEIFRNVLQGSVKKYDNVEILPYALGIEDGKEIDMGLPMTSKYLSHGRTKIVDSKPNDNYAYKFKATMRHPNQLFGSINTINYIKCDIEGYEIVVIPAMKEIIEKHTPTIQIETEGDNRKAILDLLLPLGYKVFYVDRIGLEPFEISTEGFTGDLIFIHKDRL